MRDGVGEEEAVDWSRMNPQHLDQKQGASHVASHVASQRHENGI